MPLIAASRIADGTAALERGDWEDARAAFSAALEAGESGAGWEGLGWAAWWLSDEATTLRAREAAYRTYRSEGDDAAAGRVAAWLSSDFREFRGEDAVARGWLVRAHRLLDPLPESPDHGWLALEPLVRARADRCELDAARAAFEDLERASALLGTPYLLGRVRLVAAHLAHASGEFDEARRAAEDAIDRLTDASVPYDAAVARLWLARALRGLGRSDSAAVAARAARDAFAALGAVRELGETDALLAGDTRAPGIPGAAGATAGARGAGDLGELSPREVEILRLVAQGLGDAEIADRLVLSPHTVHRHVANIRTKLRLPSRTAAVAYAARAGLL